MCALLPGLQPLLWILFHSVCTSWAPVACPSLNWLPALHRSRFPSLYILGVASMLTHDLFFLNTILLKLLPSIGLLESVSIWWQHFPQFTWTPHPAIIWYLSSSNHWKYSSSDHQRPTRSKPREFSLFMGLDVPVILHCANHPPGEEMPVSSCHGNF